MASRSAQLLVVSLTALAVAGTVGSALPAMAQTAESAAPTVMVKPAELDRGANPAIPRVLGTTILDGAHRIELTDVAEVQLYGTSAGDYVVGTFGNAGGASRIERVAPDGSRETIKHHIRGNVDLSADGLQVFESILRDDQTTRVTVRDALTGAQQSRRRFPGYVQVLVADAGRAVLGSGAPYRTFWWTPETDRTSMISHREGYFADIRADRVATIKISGPENACSALTSLSDRHTTLWRSCEQAILVSSPNGRRVLTRWIMQDGPNNTFSVHRADGRRLVTYRSAGSFGSATWETNRRALLTTYGTKRGSIVRCQLDACERASKRMRAQG